MSRSTIYLILNKQTGDKFIGSTLIGMNKEWVHHIERSKRMSSEPLHKAFREYGVHNFMIKELDECDEKDIENKTNYWMEKYNPEYNPKVEIRKEEKIIKPVPKVETNRPYSHLIPLNEETRGNGKHSGLRIKGKNLETGKVYEWESARVAAIEITGDPKKNSNILLAARKGFKCYGYKWQILEDKSKKKAVFGVNKQTEQIEVRYESIAEAIRQFGKTTSSGLVKSLRNPGRYSWRGYYWFYA